MGLLALVLVAACDQWSKAAVMAASLPYAVLPFFNLTLVHNQGISFGMFAHTRPWMPVLLTAGTSVIALALAFWLARARDAATALALGLIIGGAFGNIADRLRLGAVTDFLDFHLGAYHWPAFNIADSAIFMGVVILLFIGIVKPSKERQNA